MPSHFWMKSLSAAAGLTMVAGAALAAPPVNTGFETGLGSWTTIGSVVATPTTTVTTYNSVVWTINAFGSNMAQLNSDGATVSDIATALGLNYSQLNSLNINPNGGSLTNGSAIYQSFAGTAGETVSMFFNYVATDYIPYNDPAYAIVVNETSLTAEVISVLASTHGTGLAVGTAGNSGWNQFSYTLPSTANYKLAFVTTNDKDTSLNSVLFLDNNAGSCVPNCPSIAVSTPEPASLGILGLAAATLLGLRRRRRT